MLGCVSALLLTFIFIYTAAVETINLWTSFIPYFFIYVMVFSLLRNPCT